MRPVLFDLDGHRKELREAMVKFEVKLLEGRCSSYEDYKFNVGQLKGLNTALAQIDLTLKKVEEDEG